jgi:hypothetical protein
MAKDSFSNLTNSLVSRVKDIDPRGVVDKLSGGDRAGAISIILGQARDDAEPDDWRVRLACAPGANYLYKDTTNTLMSPLGITDGVVWPYTPEVTMSFSADYNKTSPTHSNYPIHTYKNSEVSQISITGDFTAQTPEEARYVLASMMFLRASTKMFWGNDSNAGQPPPILYLNGYGAHFFPNVPVIVRNFTSNLPAAPDYVEAWIQEDEIDLNGDSKIGKFLTRIPATVSLNVSLEPVYSRTKVANEFTFEKFSKGQLIGGPGNRRSPNGNTGGGTSGGFV